MSTTTTLDAARAKVDDPSAGTDPALESMIDGYREGLLAWQRSCPCCFSEAHPEGLQAAVEAQR